MMRRFLIFSVIHLTLNSAPAQHVGVFAGANASLYKCKACEDAIRKLNFNTGYFIGFQYQNLRDTVLPVFLRNMSVYFTQNKANYDGDLYMYKYGRNNANLIADRSWIGLSLSPLNVQLFKKKLLIYLGGNFQFSVKSRMNGFYNESKYNYDSASGNTYHYTQTNILNYDKSNMHKATAGLITGLQLQIPMRGESGFLIKTDFLIGLTPETKDFAEMKLRQFRLSLGYQLPLKGISKKPRKSSQI